MELFNDNVPAQMDKYLLGAKDLFEQIQNGDATWDDMMELREYYHLPYMTKDSLRRSWKSFKEFTENGWDLVYKDYEAKVAENSNNGKDEKDENSVDDNSGTTNGSTADIVNGRYSLTIESDGRQISNRLVYLSRDEITNSRVLLERHGYNPKEFTLVSAKHSVWEQGCNKSDDGKRTLVSSRIVVKPKERVEKEDLKEIFEEVISEGTWGTMPMKMPTPKSHKGVDTNGECLVFIQPDLHLGRVMTVEEGGKEWDIDIAIRTAKDNLLKLAVRIGDKRYDKIVYVIGNDVLNSAMTGSTTSGKHAQENGVPVRTMYKKAAEYYIWAIKTLSEFAPLKVVNCFGNHDYYETYTLGLLLEAYFHEYDEIEFDVDGQARKYFYFGENLIGISHGDSDSKRLPSLMQVEVPVMWGVTQNHYWLCGHLHHLDWKEELGVEIIHCPQLSENDNWTNRQGYIAKHRSLAFVFSKENLEEVLFLNAEEDPNVHRISVNKG